MNHFLHDVSHEINNEREYDDSHQIGHDVRCSIATSTESTHGAIEEEQIVPAVGLPIDFICKHKGGPLPNSDGWMILRVSLSRYIEEVV